MHDGCLGLRVDVGVGSGEGAGPTGGEGHAEGWYGGLAGPRERRGPGCAGGGGRRERGFESGCWRLVGAAASGSKGVVGPVSAQPSE